MPIKSKGKFEMKKYRVIESCNPRNGYTEYLIQRKKWFVWEDLGEYTNYRFHPFMFPSVEKAKAFIDSGLDKPSDPVLTVVLNVER